MASLEDLTRRVETLEQDMADMKVDMANIPDLVTRHFDLLRVEMRSMERRLDRKIDDLDRKLDRKIDDKVDAAVRAISELIIEYGKKT